MNIIDKFKIGKDISKKNLFKVYVACDANDGDIMRDWFALSKQGFAKDLLLQYVLSYISHNVKGKYNPDGNWNKECYGHYVAEDEYFPWLGDYCKEEGLLLFAGMCDMYCHSIVDIQITYFNEVGVEHEVEIPNFDTLFETIEEAQTLMNNLAEQKGYSEFIDDEEE